jgi:hypothetical protein
MTGGKNHSRVNGVRFGDDSPTANQNWLRKNGDGIYVPYQADRLDALVNFGTPITQKIPVIGTDGILTFIDVPSGGGTSPQTSVEVIYGSSTPGTNINQNVTIPTWAKTYRYRIQAAGAGSNSGIVQPTTTTAASGGATGAAGFNLDRWGRIEELTALGNTIAVSIGSPGAGGAANTTSTYKLGAQGNPATLTIAGTTIANVPGGSGSVSGTSAGSNSLRVGGLAGANGVGSGSAGNNGGWSNQLNVAASGGSGGGLTTGNSHAVGGSGSRGGTLERNPSEAVATGGTVGGGNGQDAAAVLVNGLPCPGNSPGGGGSNTGTNGGKGGNGINGSSGGGGGSCRSGTAGAGGNGGRGYLIMEFFS